MSDTGFKARVLADSVGPHGCRLTTVETRFPRCILAQVRTYGMLSYSVRSSRAVPVAAMIREVREEPFVPAVWRKAQKGMVAGELMNEAESAEARYHWLIARDTAADRAKHLSNLGAAKEHVNRLLEPFAWSWAVITGTDDAWDWLFHQRCADDAQPEFQTLAGLIRDAMRGSEPEALDAGDWHTPYVEPTDCGIEMSVDECNSADLSAARCARASYKPFDGNASLADEFNRSASLKAAGHWSPFEHQAMCMAKKARPGKLLGWMAYRTWLGQ